MLIDGEELGALTMRPSFPRRAFVTGPVLPVRVNLVAVVSGWWLGGLQASTAWVNLATILAPSVKQEAPELVEEVHRVGGRDRARSGLGSAQRVRQDGGG